MYLVAQDGDLRLLAGIVSGQLRNSVELRLELSDGGVIGARYSLLLVKRKPRFSASASSSSSSVCLSSNSTWRVWETKDPVLT